MIKIENKKADIYVQMVAEKDVITLIVKRHHFASLELWLEMKYRGQHSAHGVAKPGGHVVDDHFRSGCVEFGSIL